MTEEGALASLPAGPGPLPDPFLVDGVLVCDLTTSPTLVLKPTLVMEILGQEYEVADIEIPIELPPFAENIRFDAITMSFPRPAAVEPTTGADSEGDSHGMSGGEDEPTTSGAAETGGTGEDTGSSTDADGSASGGQTSGDDGCGCRSSGSSGALVMLALLGRAPRRRKRRG
ncbi:MYXO-CTERM sorting domain-containing protein [Nannocystis pusilla]|uniref:MYXO-CTERM sorting domain-containing protein n=1 Tax=Nannocystis pusilla TaxID=889268 RepID=UPI003B808FC6